METIFLLLTGSLLAVFTVDIRQKRRTYLNKSK